MNSTAYVKHETAWCPGCGNFSILDTLKSTLEKMGLDPHDVLLVGGIGQAAKTPQYLNTNTFCGLHGRALPPAVAAKIVNPGLTVIINTGDGDSYGEGGNHFLHNIRRNVDVAHFVHDNQVYGLTKGQASPTTMEGMATGAQPEGSMNSPFNPVLLALAAGAGFVARSFSGRPEHLQAMMERAIRYKGYALVDILQNCVSFNKLNTFAWYNSRVQEIDVSHDPTDLMAAMRLAMTFGDQIPIGVLYEQEGPDYHARHSLLQTGHKLVGRGNDPAMVERLMRRMV
ncbi:MAG: 2-oxoacid:ferredoxin oxidoreductase subunit beta [Clostridiales bacterium]|nr:2-oxoacid:ferredoxin oxidoreductase subunit beta [Clostridiales bacterium]